MQFDQALFLLSRNLCLKRRSLLFARTNQAPTNGDHMNHTRKRTHGAACLPLLLGVALALLLGPTSTYAGSNYQQVTGGADGTNPKAVASQFEFTSGISANYDKTKVV